MNKNEKYASRIFIGFSLLTIMALQLENLQLKDEAEYSVCASHGYSSLKETHIEPKANRIVIVCQ